MVAAVAPQHRAAAAQRERTARLAVAAEQARITTDLRGTLRAGIDEIGALARAARDSGADPGPGFAAIECAGRSVLDSMRHVVGTLRDAPTDPEPGLAELPGLLASATAADARLSVTGPVRPLPASIELAAYRIVEQLLTVLRDDPATRVEVRVRFAADCLELRIAGPPATGDDLRQVRSVVQARLGPLRRDVRHRRRGRAARGTDPAAAGHQPCLG